MMATDCYAQFTNTTGKGASEEKYSISQIGYVSYANSREIEKAHGVSAGLVKGKRILDQYPIYIESGANLSYFFSSEDVLDDIFDDDLWDDYDDDYDYWCKDRIQWLNVSVPLNLSYIYELDQNVSISPFFGPALRVNILGKETYEDEDGKETWNMFSKKDWEGETPWRRVQLLGSVGLRLNYKKLSVAYQFQGEFVRLRKWVKGYQNSISIGVVLQ